RGCALFPYTTLFRSGIEPRRELHRADEVAEEDRQLAALASEPEVGPGCGRRGRSGLGRSIGVRRRRPALGAELRGGRQIRLAARSEEHTSELQSPCN